MIVNQPPMRNFGTDQDIRKYLEELQQLVNGMLELGTNIGGEYIDVNFVAGIAQNVPHHLGIRPYGYIVTSKIGPGDIFRPIGGLFDASTITLQCTNTIAATIFVIGCKKPR